MARPIEVVNFSETSQVSDLATLVWSNGEPGFQIDGVSSVEELYVVFDALRATAPTEDAQATKFVGVYPDRPDAFDETLPSVNAHIDGWASGLAVHQNMSSPIVVKLAHPKPSFDKYPLMNERFVSDLRVGETVPGRLTVFSEGGYKWLEPTAHHFIRTDQKKEWVRYTQENCESIYCEDEELVRLMAQAAFTKLDQHSVIASGI